jgi:hypothetical protein
LYDNGEKQIETEVLDGGFWFCGTLGKKNGIWILNKGGASDDYSSIQESF